MVHMEPRRDERVGRDEEEEEEEAARTVVGEAGGVVARMGVEEADDEKAAVVSIDRAGEGEEIDGSKIIITRLGFLYSFHRTPYSFFESRKPLLSCFIRNPLNSSNAFAVFHHSILRRYRCD